MPRKPQSKLTKYIVQRRSYLLGIVLGLTLLIVNSIVGLLVVKLVLDAAAPVGDGQVTSVPVPKINESSYTTFRDDYLDRQKKELSDPPSQNPFNSD